MALREGGGAGALRPAVASAQAQEGEGGSPRGASGIDEKEGILEAWLYMTVVAPRFQSTITTFTSSTESKPSTKSSNQAGGEPVGLNPWTTKVVFLVTFKFPKTVELMACAQVGFLLV